MSALKELFGFIHASAEWATDYTLENKCQKCHLNIILDGVRLQKKIDSIALSGLCLLRLSENELHSDCRYGSGGPAANKSRGRKLSQWYNGWTQRFRLELTLPVDCSSKHQRDGAEVEMIIFFLEFSTYLVKTLPPRLTLLTNLYFKTSSEEQLNILPWGESEENWARTTDR